MSANYQNNIESMGSNLQQKESLLSLIGLLYIESNQLLGQEQLLEAKASLYAMYLHTTGEESVLRKLITLLKTNQVVNRTFSELSKILDGIETGTKTIIKKTNYLKKVLSGLQFSADEYSAFIDPLLNYSRLFSEKTIHFNRLMQDYWVAKEQEAKDSNNYKYACEERSRLKERLKANFMHHTSNNLENKIKNKVIQTFDYDEAKNNLIESQNRSNNLMKKIQIILSEIDQLCQMILRPELRCDHYMADNNSGGNIEDIYYLYISNKEQLSELELVDPLIVDLFKIYKHSHGIFNLDFHKFNTVITPIIDDASDYFIAKEENEDIKTNKDKLAKIEGLIAFLENASTLLKNTAKCDYENFSFQLSKNISQPGTAWQAISEFLLQTKVSAEIELSVRQSAIIDK